MFISVNYFTNKIGGSKFLSNAFLFFLDKVNFFLIRMRLLHPKIHPSILRHN